MPDTCPCCGHPLNVARDPSAHAEKLRLSSYEQALFRRLAKSFGQWVYTETLIDTIYGDDSDGGPEAAASAVAGILKGLRKKLRASDLWVETQFGRGNGARRLLWKSPGGNQLGTAGITLQKGLEPHAAQA